MSDDVNLHRAYTDAGPAPARAAAESANLPCGDHGRAVGAVQVDRLKPSLLKGDVLSTGLKRLKAKCLSTQGQPDVFNLHRPLPGPGKSSLSFYKSYPRRSGWCKLPKKKNKVQIESAIYPWQHQVLKLVCDLLPILYQK